MFQQNLGARVCWGLGLKFRVFRGLRYFRDQGNGDRGCRVKGVAF